MVLLNIDMPKCCARCPIYDDRWDYPTCYVTGKSKGYKFNPFEKRMSDCPLRYRKNEEIRQRQDIRIKVK